VSADRQTLIDLAFGVATIEFLQEGRRIHRDDIEQVRKTFLRALAREGVDLTDERTAIEALLREGVNDGQGCGQCSTCVNVAKKKHAVKLGAN
jgi:hypothetical protein